MKVIVELQESDLNDIEKLISEGKISSISAFISLAIRNQIMIEEGQTATPSLDSYFSAQKSEPPITLEKKYPIGEVQTVNEIDVFDEFPFWATQNKYLCLKQITLDFSSLVEEEDTLWLRYDIVMNRILQEAVKTRKRFEKIDKHFHRGRGMKLSTGFPKNDSKSTSRYEKQFIGGIDGKGRKYGLAVEIGFLDVRSTEANRIEFALTDMGLAFSKLHSYVMDKNISDLDPTTPPLCEEEVQFILSILEKRKQTEVELMKFTLNYINDGKNHPEDGASITKEYLDKRYPEISISKSGNGFSLSESETIRAGVVSRMNELGLISIQKNGLKSNYLITNKGSDFLTEGRK